MFECTLTIENDIDFYTESWTFVVQYAIQDFQLTGVPPYVTFEQSMAIGISISQGTQPASIQSLPAPVSTCRFTLVCTNAGTNVTVSYVTGDTTHPEYVWEYYESQIDSVHNFSKPDLYFINISVSNLLRCVSDSSVR